MHWMTSQVHSVIARDAGALRAEGWRLWWLQLYETDRLSFTLLTLGAIVLAGAILGFLTDALIRRLGIDLNSRETGDQ